MRFFFTSRMMVWLHPCPLGGKRGLRKEELHIGSSFSSVHATSPLLRRCILLQGTLSPSSPTLPFCVSSLQLFLLPFSSQNPKSWTSKELYKILHVQVGLFKT